MLSKFYKKPKKEKMASSVLIIEELMKRKASRKISNFSDHAFIPGFILSSMICAETGSPMPFCVFLIVALGVRRAMHKPGYLTNFFGDPLLNAVNSFDMEGLNILQRFIGDKEILNYDDLLSFLGLQLSSLKEKLSEQSIYSDTLPLLLKKSIQQCADDLGITLPSNPKLSVIKSSFITRIGAIKDMCSAALDDAVTDIVLEYTTKCDFKRNI